MALRFVDEGVPAWLRAEKKTGDLPGLQSEKLTVVYSFRMDNLGLLCPSPGAQA